jgi:hypothetical protein
MKKHQILMLIALMFVTVFVFYPALNAGFVNLDDKGLVTDNWKIRSLSAENLKSLLLESHYKMYHPLVNLSYAVEYYFFGQDPYFYHADNLILHLFNALFAFFIFFGILVTQNNICFPGHIQLSYHTKLCSFEEGASYHGAEKNGTPSRINRLLIKTFGVYDNYKNMLYR